MVVHINIIDEEYYFFIVSCKYFIKVDTYIPLNEIMNEYFYFKCYRDSEIMSLLLCHCK